MGQRWAWASYGVSVQTPAVGGGIGDIFGGIIGAKAVSIDVHCLKQNKLQKHFLVLP